jgi:RimJ/RimL family protein N-acetyltransferase
VFALLEGKTVNLRVAEKEDVPFLVDWWSNSGFAEYFSPTQVTRTGMERFLENTVLETKHFIIEKKDGSKIGYICHFTLVHPAGKHLEIGYFLVPSERGKGYGTEALGIMVDYLFLSKDVMRIQVQTDPRNVASQKVIEKVGFRKEGTLRKNFFMRGEWVDAFIYSILREEWKEPKILTKTT